MYLFRLTGAKVNGTFTVPHETHVQASYESSVWDTDGFYQPSVADNELVIRSPKRAGHYQISVAVRWHNPWQHGVPNLIPLPPVEDLIKMRYYTYVQVNGVGIGIEGRSTANAVAGAQSTTQHFAAERNLEANDVVCVKLWQYFGIEVKADVVLGLRRIGRRAPMLMAVAEGPG